MIDGVSGVDILQLLMSPEERSELPAPEPFQPRPAPSGSQLLVEGDPPESGACPSRRGSRLSSASPRRRPIFRRELGTRLRADGERRSATSIGPASETPINGPIGPHRRFDWFRTPIADIKQMRKSLGGSLNDIVLTAVTGAFRRFFLQRGIALDDLDFRVMTPVSVRSESEQGQLGNRVSAWFVPLPLAESDPRKQLREIVRTTAELKESRQAIGADVLMQAAEWTPSTLLSLAGRNLTRMSPFNTVVTNVPGPQQPMYLLGSRLVDLYPHVPLVDHLGLGIALMSYDGQMHWGVNADRDRVPDLHDFVIDLESALGRAAGAGRLASEGRRGRRPPGSAV